MLGSSFTCSTLVKEKTIVSSVNSRYQRKVLEYKHDDNKRLEGLMQLLQDEREHYSISSDNVDIGGFLFVQQVLKFWNVFSHLEIRNLKEWGGWECNNERYLINTDYFIQIIHGLDLWSSFELVYNSISSSSISLITRELLCAQNREYKLRIWNIVLQYSSYSIQIDLVQVIHDYLVSNTNSICDNMIIMLILYVIRIVHGLLNKKNFNNLQQNNMMHPKDNWKIIESEVVYNSLISNTTNPLDVIKLIDTIFTFTVEKLDPSQSVNELKNISFSSISNLMEDMISLHGDRNYSIFNEGVIKKWNNILSLIKESLVILPNEQDNMMEDNSISVNNTVPLSTKLLQYENNSINILNIINIRMDKDLYSYNSIFDKYTNLEIDEIVNNFLNNTQLLLDYPQEYIRTLELLFIDKIHSITLSYTLYLFNTMKTWKNIIPTKIFENIQDLFVSHFSKLSIPIRTKLLLQLSNQSNLKYRTPFDEYFLLHIGFSEKLNVLCNRMVTSSKDDNVFNEDFDVLWLLSPCQTLYRLIEEAIQHGSPHLSVITSFLCSRYELLNHHFGNNNILIVILVDTFTSVIESSDKYKINFIELIRILLQSTIDNQKIISVDNTNTLLNINEFMAHIIQPNLHSNIPSNRLLYTLQILSECISLEIYKNIEEDDSSNDWENQLFMICFARETTPLILYTDIWKVILNVLQLLNNRMKLSLEIVENIRTIINRICDILKSITDDDKMNHLKSIIFSKDKIEEFLSIWEQFSWNTKQSINSIINIIDNSIQFTFPPELQNILNTKILPENNDWIVKYLNVIRMSENISMKIQVPMNLIIHQSKQTELIFGENGSIISAMINILPQSTNSEIQLILTSIYGSVRFLLALKPISSENVSIEKEERFAKSVFNLLWNCISELSKSVLSIQKWIEIIVTFLYQREKKDNIKLHEKLIRLSYWIHFACKIIIEYENTTFVENYILTTFKEITNTLNNIDNESIKDSSAIQLLSKSIETLSTLSFPQIEILKLELSELIEKKNK